MLPGHRRKAGSRGRHATFRGLESICGSQPCALRGMDSDNGGGFLNFHLYNWPKEQGIRQTRSRPYCKNDQAHVERKNHAHARLLLGYERFGHPELLEPLNNLLTGWSLFKNPYSVTMKQTGRWREGSRRIRRHGKESRPPGACWKAGNWKRQEPGTSASCLNRPILLK